MNNTPADAVMLTATQKGVLAVIYNTPTPETAFDTINGQQALVTARNILERLGLIAVAGNRAILTPAGKNAVIANNIADPSGKLTDDGKAMIDAVNTLMAESFSLLKSLMI